MRNTEMRAMLEASEPYQRWAKHQSGYGGEVNPDEFMKYQAGLQAWRLHQGPGGAMHQKKTSRAFGGPEVAPIPQTLKDMPTLRSSMDGRNLNPAASYDRRYFA